MITAPFLVMGNSFIITVGVASQSVPVILVGATGLNLAQGNNPPQIRLLNKGTGDVWINFSSGAAQAAVIPVAGTTTMGTPQPDTWAAPGIEITLTMPVGYQPLISVPGLNTQPLGFWMNVIGAVAATPLYCSVGEGI